MRIRRRSLLFVALLPLVLAGCFGALADLNKYEVGGGGDFCWHLLGFSPHAVSAGAMPQFVELRVIDSTNQVDAVAVYDPLPTAEVTGTLAGPLDPTSTYHVQIFADFNRDRMLEAYPTDHTWDLDYEAHLVSSCFTFMHGAPFNMPDTVASRADDPNSGDAILNIGSRVLADGRVLIMTLRDVDLGADIAFYRYEVHPTVDPIALHDIIGGDASYKLDAFVDMNDNGVQDPGEHAFSDTEISGAAGADLTFSIDLMRPLP